MGRFVIEGGRKLGGRMRVQGAKNSALPILAATVAVGRPCVIHNCPSLTDIDSTLGILKALGCEVHRSGDSYRYSRRSDEGNALVDYFPRRIDFTHGRGTPMCSRRL